MLFEGEVVMSSLILIGSDLNVCGGLLEVVKVIYKLISILIIVIPILLVLLGTFDLGKAVMASDEKEIKQAQNLLIKRLIYAAIIFFVPTLVGVIMNILASGKSDETADINPDSWKACWKAAQK